MTFEPWQWVLLYGAAMISGFSKTGIPGISILSVSIFAVILPARQSTDAPGHRASKAASVERVLELQPSARVRWFEDTVHDIPLQRPDELAAELRAFAARALPQHTRL